MNNELPRVKLSDICRPTQWPTIPQSQMTDDGYPVFGANGRIGYYTEYNHEHPTVLITCRGATCGTINVCDPKSYVTGNAMALDDLDPQTADRRFVAYALNWRGLRDAITGSAQPQITRTSLSGVEIPLPPLSEQKRIADILDKADAIRRKRQEALIEIETLPLSVYRNQFGHPLAASDVVPLGECVTILSGGTPSKSNDSYWNGDFPWVSPKDMKVDYICVAEDHVTDLAFQETTLKKLPKASILIVVRGMILAHTIPVALTDVPVAINQDMKALIANDGYDPHFLCWSLKAAHNYILGRVATAAHGTKRLDVEHLTSFPIPRVTLSEQRHFARIAQKIRDSRDRLATGEPEGLFNALVQRAFKGEL